MADFNVNFLLFFSASWLLLSSDLVIFDFHTGWAFDRQDQSKHSANFSDGDV